MKNKQTGLEKFNTYYKEVWGDRWESLVKALKKDSIKVYRKNKWCSFNPVGDQFIEDCYKSGEIKEIEGLKNFYYMDPASVIVAKNLEITQGSRVLDMCAAPGGKSLILFEKLNETGKLVCNELSKNRRERLKRVLSEHIGPKRFESVDVRGHDGNKYGIHIKDDFDFCLLDAPCSGEKHLMETESEMEKWSPKRTKKLSAGQYSLLCSAMQTVKAGGQIVYSTCSLSPLENDEVIKKALSKKGDRVELDLEGINTFGYGEKTDYGYLFLPDKCGFGPLYLSRLKVKGPQN